MGVRTFKPPMIPSAWGGGGGGVGGLVPTGPWGMHPPQICAPPAGFV